MPRTINLVDVVEGHIHTMTINRNDAGDVICTVNYAVQSDGGLDIFHRQFTVTLSAGQKQTLRDFLANVVVPQINASEGM